MQRGPICKSDKIVARKLKCKGGRERGDQRAQERGRLFRLFALKLRNCQLKVETKFVKHLSFNIVKHFKNRF